MSDLEQAPEGFLPEADASRALGLSRTALGGRRRNGTAPEHVLVDGRAFYDPAVIAAQATGPQKGGRPPKQGPVSAATRRRRWIAKHGPAWRQPCAACGAPADVWSESRDGFEAFCLPHR